MGCTSSNDGTYAPESITQKGREEARKLKKKKAQEQQEPEEENLQKMMHDKQIELSGQARPLLQTRSSLRSAHSPGSPVDPEAVKRRAQARQAKAIRQAGKDRSWMVILNNVAFCFHVVNFVVTTFLIFIDI